MRPPRLRRAAPAYLFFGVFSGERELLAEVRRLVEAGYGPLHPRGESAILPFPETRTYAKSMGAGLERQFFVPERRLPQDGLSRVKREAFLMEEVIRSRWSARLGVARPVNIDPGLINDCRVVLATTKDHAHRLYRGDGIWEEVTLIYRDGRFQPLPWTYRDFRDPAYHHFFEVLRDELLEEVGRERRPG